MTNTPVVTALTGGIWRRIITRRRVPNGKGSKSASVGQAVGDACAHFQQSSRARRWPRRIGDVQRHEMVRLWPMIGLTPRLDREQIPHRDHPDQLVVVHDRKV